MDHTFLHDTLSLSTPYLLGVAGLSIAASALGLLLTHVRNFSAASRHLILSIALIAPLFAAVLATTEIRSFFAPKTVEASRPILEITTAGAASSLMVRTAPASELPCILFFIWLGGSTFFLVATARPWLRWTRIAQQARTADDPALVAAFGTRTSPRLAVSEFASEPMVVGIFRPVVLLPVGYAEELDAAELQSVFAHELEHVRRRDNFTAAIHELACAFFWFDPLHWIARQRLLDLRERACDERVLDLGCEPDPYLSALVKSCHAAIDSPAVACMSGFHVRERIDSIMSYASDRTQFLPESFVRVAAVVVAVIAVSLFGVTASAPSLAAASMPEKAPSTQYQFDAVVVPTGTTGQFVIDVTIFAPGGDRVLSSKITAAAGKPVRFSTIHDGKTFQVDVTPSTDGSGIATMEVLEGTASVYRTVEPLTVVRHRPVPPNPAWPPIAAEPVSLNLRDANIHDVLRTFSQMSGWTITASPSLTNRITIAVTDVPWDVALGRVLALDGLTLMRVGEKELQVIPAGMAVVPRMPSPLLEDGYERVGGDVKAPVVISRVEPFYPDEARTARISGIVIVEAGIDETGAVKSVRILKNLPHGLGEAAADAVRQWNFRPGTKDGKPIPVIFNLTVNFRLDEDVQP